MGDTMKLQISWFLGFGWVSIIALVFFGVAINLLTGPIVWLMYVPFLVVALYMTVRFRLFTMHPWRRVHGRAMLKFSGLAEKEYEAAKLAGRDYDVARPCRELLHAMFEQPGVETASLLNDAERKLYYKGLVKEFPEIFLKSFASSDPQTVFNQINKDIDASELGPDILIAKDVELKYSRKEAATYLQSLMLGTVR